jgi:hypothetical protein
MLLIRRSAAWGADGDRHAKPSFRRRKKGAKAGRSAQRGERPQGGPEGASAASHPVTVSPDSREKGRQVLSRKSHAIAAGFRPAPEWRLLERDG